MDFHLFFDKKTIKINLIFEKQDNFCLKNGNFNQLFLNCEQNFLCNYGYC